MLEAGGDFTQIDQADMDAVASEFFTDEFDAAAQNVDAWRADNCTRGDANAAMNEAPATRGLRRHAG